MNDEVKTKAELIKELKTLRKEQGESASNDITEGKQAEETLRKSQQEFASLFRGAPEALVYADDAIRHG